MVEISVVPSKSMNLCLQRIRAVVFCFFSLQPADIISFYSAIFHYRRQLISVLNMFGPFTYNRAAHGGVGNTRDDVLASVVCLP